MNKKNIAISQSLDQPIKVTPTITPQAPPRGVVLCGLGLLFCILVSISPLLHIAGKTFLLRLPTNPFLLAWGAWLPYDLHLMQPQRTSMIATNTIEFVILITLSFVMYALCAFIIRRQEPHKNFITITRIIWLVAVLGGLIYILTPSMPSRDIFVYVGYGRTIALHHANPYFVPPAAFPKDPLTIYDDWQNATAAYGPLWLAICSILAFIPGDSPLRYLLAFRLLSFASYLLNIWLIAIILKKMGRAPRTVTLGTLLYAWNPLVIEETCLGGHNDTIMVTLLLLGLWFSLRGEQQNYTRTISYLLPIMAFTLATLVKITALPFIALFLVLLACRTMGTASIPLLRLDLIPLSRWLSALQKVLLAAIVSGLLLAIFYAPFWVGHSIHDIVQSFSTPPSALLSENSMMRAVVEWIKSNGLPAPASLAYTPLNFFSQRKVWDSISYAFMAATVLLGAIWLWRVPTTRTLILAALLSLDVLLLVTPWFFPWYIIWLLSLAALCLPLTYDRLGRALTVLMLTFSATAFVTYLANINHWNGWYWLVMAGPPVLVFFFLLKQKRFPLLAKSGTIEQTNRAR